jgi:Ankyrin repeats (many copies)
MGTMLWSLKAYPSIVTGDLGLTMANRFLFESHETSTAATRSRHALTWNSVFQRTANIPEDIHLDMVNYISNIQRKGNAPSIQFMNSKLLSIMPEIHVGEHLSIAMKILGPITQDASLQMMELMIYLLSNNLLNPSPNGGEDMIRWLRLEENFCILQHLLSISSPTTEALAEAVFQSAVKAEDIRIVKTLINTSLSPDGPVIKESYVFYTPLQYASFRGNLELAHILIEAGANVNAAANSYDDMTALQLAARSRNPELIKMLL